ncbi:hypothetical protein ABBQ38_009928 [Trebouxia sp. C0009 RCD-2024]
MPLSAGYALPTARTLSSLRVWHLRSQAQYARPQQLCGCHRHKRQLIVKAQGREDGEFGARDPTAGEIGSGFGLKPLGNADTSHIIRVPEGMKKHLGLAAKKCVPCEAGKAKALTDVEVNSIQNQTPGWQVITNAQGHRCLRQQWKVKNFKAGLEVFERIGKIAEQEGHHPDLHLEGYNTVAADLSTHSVGGLTENDFVMASKINLLDLTDLQQKKKARTYFF